MIKPIAALLLSTPLLYACAGTPEFETVGVQAALTPAEVKKENTDYEGSKVFWGGVIVRTRNLETATHIEVVSYPLDEDGWPQADHEPQGRFIIEQQGYLEPAKYAASRRITIVGTILATLQGKVGESNYLFPVVKAEQLHLWASDYPQSKPQIHFGIGIGISR